MGSISANMEAYIDLIRFFEGCFPVAATSSKTVKYEDVVGGFAVSCFFMWFTDSGCKMTHLLLQPLRIQWWPLLPSWIWIGMKM